MSTTWLHLYVPDKATHVFTGPIPPLAFDAAHLAKRSEWLEKSPKPRVLVVDDERIIADTVTAILNRSGFDAVARYGGEDAIAFIHQECPDIVLSDVMMPETNGVQVAAATKKHCPNTRIVLISGNAATPHLIEHAMPEGSPFELLPKPIHPINLLKILRG